MKNEQKRGRVVLFLIIGVRKIRYRFGAVLEGSWGGFWRLFGPDLVDFEGSRRNQNSRPSLNAKHGGKFSESRGAGGRGDGLWERRFRPRT